jgi:hypothetical protein
VLRTPCATAYDLLVTLVNRSGEILSIHFVPVDRRHVYALQYTPICEGVYVLIGEYECSWVVVFEFGGQRDRLGMQGGIEKQVQRSAIARSLGTPGLAAGFSARGHPPSAVSSALNSEVSFTTPVHSGSPSRLWRSDYSNSYMVDLSNDNDGETESYTTSKTRYR